MTDQITVDLADLRRLLELENEYWHSGGGTHTDDAVIRLRRVVDTWRHPHDCGVADCEHRGKRFHVHLGLPRDGAEA